MDRIDELLAQSTFPVRFWIAWVRLRRSASGRSRERAIQKLINLLVKYDLDATIPKLTVRPAFAARDGIGEQAIYSIFDLKPPKGVTPMPDARSALAAGIETKLRAMDEKATLDPLEPQSLEYLKRRLNAILEPCIAATMAQYGAIGKSFRLTMGWGLPKGRELQYFGNDDYYLLAWPTHAIELQDWTGYVKGCLVVNLAGQREGEGEGSEREVLATMGMIHQNCKRKYNRPRAEVLGISTDGHCFRFWRIDDKSQVYKSRCYSSEPLLGGAGDLTHVVSNIQHMLGQLCVQAMKSHRE